MIKAPFNFVPLSEKVFFPPWASQVSHDIPFSDGESGVIDVTVTAKSPIFIRDGKEKEEFCHVVNPDGSKQYYIPGSSFKGMIRNVLEIMSFSKMSEIDDSTYSIRDLHNSDLYMSKMNNILSGWLKKDGDSYVIEDCDKPGRIKHEEIENNLSIGDFAKKFKKGTFDNKDKSKTAKYKYELLKSLGKNLNEVLKERSFDFDFEATGGRKVYKKGDSKKGRIVLTGQPSGRKEAIFNEDGTVKIKANGKIYEFIFFNQENSNELKVEENVMKNFLFAYFDERETQPKESPDWKFWKKELNNGGKVPVFFQKDNQGNVKHFGLSYLYKLPYEHSVKDGLPKNHRCLKLDLAQAMFGYIISDKKHKEEAVDSKIPLSLKGRIQFGHLNLDNNINILLRRGEVLGSPKASYYPIYIRQDRGQYNTYMDNNFNLAGWKIYPIHKSIKVTTGTNNVKTYFHPLNENSIFKGKIRFHNLRKSEIGALLSALTFHNTQGCFHNIGMAKSLGYGKIKLEPSLENLKYDISEYLKEFELEMNSNIHIPDNSWGHSIQIEELFTMASEQDNSTLEYMELKEFASNKNDNGTRNFLSNYSSLDGIIKKNMTSLLSKNEIKNTQEIAKNRKEEKIKIEEKLRLEKEEKERLYLEKEKEEGKFKLELKYVNNTSEINVIESFIERYPSYEDLNSIIDKKNRLKSLRENERANEHKELNEKFDSALKRIGNGDIKKLKKFIKKWTKNQENKGSKYILNKIKEIL